MQSGKITFFNVALKGYLRLFFIMSLILLLAGVIASAILLYLEPKDKVDYGKTGTLSIEVLDSTEQPVVVEVSHSFTIMPVGSDYFIVESPETVDYYITVEGSDGKAYFNASGTLSVPDTLSVSSSDQGSFSHDESYGESVELEPGRYSVSYSASSEITCKVDQKYKYEGFKIMMLFLGFIGALFMVLWVIVSVKALRSGQASVPRTGIMPMSNYQQAPPVYAAPNPGLYGPQGGQVPQTAYSPQIPQYPAYQGQTSAEPVVQSQEQAQSPDPNKTNLGYQQGGYYMEMMCGNCRQLVRSPPENGIITCEHCGHKARAF